MPCIPVARLNPIICLFLRRLIHSRDSRLVLEQVAQFVVVATTTILFITRNNDTTLHMYCVIFIYFMICIKEHDLVVRKAVTFFLLIDWPSL